MQVTYHHPAADLYVVQGREIPDPVLLAGFSHFDNDTPFNEADPVLVELVKLDPDHCIIHHNERNGYTYVARRDGVTITFAQWLRTDQRSFGNEYLIEALDAVIAYRRPAMKAVSRVQSWTNGSHWRNYKLDWFGEANEGDTLYVEARK